MIRLLAASLALLICAASVNAQTQNVKPDIKPPTGKGISVRDLGAVGDGIADDTAAFEAAIVTSAQTRDHVLVPPGRYRITKTLTLKAQTMYGAVAGAWVSDNNALPQIIPDVAEGPCIRLTAGGAVHGLAFIYDWKGKTPSPVGPCIELAGIGPRVTDCKIHGAWDAIAADGKANVGRTLIDSCFIVDVHNIGIKILGTWDVSWISKVEVWSPGSKIFPVKGIGFLIGKNDVLIMADCFVFNANVGYKLTETVEGSNIKGGMWGTMANCTADFTGIGVEVDGAHTVSLAGGSYWTHWNGMVIKGNGAQVRMSGLEMKSNGGPVLDIQNARMLAVSGCQFRREMKRFKSPALRINEVETAAITGNVIRCCDKALDIKKGLKGLVFANNVVKENTEEDKQEPNNAP